MDYFRPLSKEAGRLGDVFAFPHAGGSAAVFRRLADALGDDVRIWVAQLPGRGPRWREQQALTIEEIVKPACDWIGSQTSGRPYILLGSSFGAHVAYRTAACLATFENKPVGVVAVASPPPHRRRTEALRHLSDQALIEQIGRLGGLDAEVAASSEMLEFIVLSLRADIHIYETYAAFMGAPIEFPLAAIWGLADRSLDPASMEEWRTCTSGAFSNEAVDGGHFLVSSDPEPVANRIRRQITA